MTDEPKNYRRQVLTCPKCGGAKMFTRELKEMFVHPHGQQPLYGATGEVQVVCECGVVVWPAKVEKKKAEKAA